MSFLQHMGIQQWRLRGRKPVHVVDEPSDVNTGEASVEAGLNAAPLADAGGVDSLKSLVENTTAGSIQIPEPTPDNGVSKGEPAFSLDTISETPTESES